MSDFEVVVIGAGPGGYPAAIRSAQLGMKTAIIEKEAMGGTCLNWGCIPTKSLIASAERFAAAENAEVYGVKCEKVSFDYAAMVARKDEIVAKLSGGVRQLLTANGVEIIEGTARLEGKGRISIAGETTRWITADKIILATGSVSAMPGFLPKHPRVIESRKFLELKKLPASLLVLGGGVIGCEFACLAAELGTKVTIVEMLDDILPPVDKDTRRVLRRKLEAEGVRIITGAPLGDIKANDSGVSGVCNGEEISAEMLLVSIGRTVNTRGLGLENVGIEVDKKGQIPVDAQCRTACASIFAIGDIVAGTIQLAHNATAQGEIAAEAASGGKRKVEKIVPSCIFTSPEIGIVGMTEEQARAAGYEVKTGTFNFTGLGKALAAGTPEGFVKWVADGATGQLIGAQVVGSHATELIATAAVAVRNEITAAAFAHTIQSHPTLSEAWMEAANAVEGCCVHAAPKRRR